MNTIRKSFHVDTLLLSFNYIPDRINKTRHTPAAYRYILPNPPPSVQSLIESNYYIQILTKYFHPVYSNQF
ncbi:hypothetical protein HMPREF1250_1496 [Megasphaera vaginalis (ex Srinivasan et al. 2021)]|uniref:Uncharacterized protein n=1 Tax=Megasphaera vaginalis (ex Srinivasan et al. 2021) TaxID=1111454 RepID=U7UAJ5_9FIRM|nr:hypothetical protein HMPREF1250_1496 [Megasphaera vaginalis (ex Srinivasan et al. 2021)]